MLLCKEILRPGVPGETATNISNSYLLAIAAGAVLIVSAALIVYRYRQSCRAPLIAWGVASLLAMGVHPAWSFPTNEGDCGLGRYVFSWGMAGLLVIALLIQIGVMFWPRRALDPERENYLERP